MSKKLEVMIAWGDSYIDSTYQLKVFENEDDLLMWCRRNAKHIQAINGTVTDGQPLTHIEIVRAVRGDCF